MMNLNYLPWDSSFFEKCIANLEITQQNSDTELANLLSSNDFDCCYVICNYPSKLSTREILLSLGGHCYDRKVIYRKNLSCESDQNLHDISVEKVVQADVDIYDLAVQSGWHSRFVLDPHFIDKQPDLYRRWVDNCLQDEHSAILAIQKDGKAVAMSAVSAKNDCGKIQLIAVSEAYRGHGLGKILMTNSELFFVKNNCCVAEVVTQLDNQAACSLYEHFGYTQAEIKEVWHVWKS